MDFCPLAGERVLWLHPSGDGGRWAVLLALHDPGSPPTKHFSCPTLFRFGEGRVGREEGRKWGRLGW